MNEITEPLMSEEENKGSDSENDYNLNKQVSLNPPEPEEENSPESDSEEEPNSPSEEAEDISDPPARANQENFIERMGSPEYYHIWGIIGWSFEAVLNIGLIVLSYIAASGVELNSIWDIQVYNILQFWAMFILFTRLNWILHVMHFLWKHKLGGAYIPIALFFSEVSVTLTYSWWQLLAFWS